MATTVVSGFSRDGYSRYGKQFIDTFHRFSPINYNLVVYVADPVPMPSGRYILHSELDGAREFVDRHKNKLEYCGLSPTPGWRKKDHRNGYCYRFDAVKFCWQMFYPEHAAQSLDDGDALAWFDGDVVFTGAIPSNFVESALAGADLAYLGRATHTELGFWAVRIAPSTRKFLRLLAETYRSDWVFKLDEWHSAFVFDHTRHVWPVRERNLTPGDKGNVWTRTPLDAFSKHLKGKLKDGQH